MKIPDNKKYVLFGGVFVLANKLQAVADKRVHGLSTKQWFLLRNLSELPIKPPATITALARETDTSRQNVSKMLEVLQRLGYVILRNSAEDRRSQTVEITVAGRKILCEVAQEASPFFEGYFSGLEQEEIEAASAVIVKLINNLYKMQEDMK